MAPPSRRLFSVRQSSQIKTVDCITSAGREFGQTYLPAGAEFLGVSPRAARHDSGSKRSGGSSVGANTAEFLSVHCQRERLRFASVTARLATGPWPANNEWESLSSVAPSRVLRVLSPAPGALNSTSTEKWQGGAKFLGIPRRISIRRLPDSKCLRSRSGCCRRRHANYAAAENLPFAGPIPKGSSCCWKASAIPQPHGA